jgi:hypothetical protein
VCGALAAGADVADVAVPDLLARLHTALQVRGTATGLCALQRTLRPPLRYDTIRCPSRITIRAVAAPPHKPFPSLFQAADAFEDDCEAVAEVSSSAFLG